MSFNRDIKTDPNRVSTSAGSGRRGALVGGGSVITVVAVLLLSQLTGIDLTGLLDTSSGAGQSAPGNSAVSPIDVSMCTSGEAANSYTQCRMVSTAESLDAVWGEQLAAQTGTAYAKPDFHLWDGAQISTACGTASSAAGPFYCPGDSTVYLDMSFFSQMTSTLGAADTPLAEEYIVAHEFGHHIQNLLGTMRSADRSGTGATSDSVRLELQADCYAGLWVHYASSTVDPDTGVPFLVEPTQAQVHSAIDAAEAVGDDHIQERSGVGVNADSWTHGASEQRVRWFTVGMQQGSVQACDTFAVADTDL
ncbi:MULTISPECIES: KPN_02809 family neutral zinc metallopeptidase [Actinomyces]|uniref:Neutral zinc metallopeptidase n=1 Tax=Actinomyces respiraculi TaxID=2744574 RepID=A0A7T0LM54_9ACTO|nr:MULTISPECIES: neutral zinc metallopeptidase [Actinomyces]QPL06344.1 neutral zinc metallopeptidase [Actinomyces respiraculi]